MSGTVVSGRSSTPDDAEPLLDLTFSRESMPTVRREVGRCAADRGLTDDLQRAKFVTAVNEIATNAVSHGGGRGALRLWLDGGVLWCQVSDSGRGIHPRWLDTSTRSGPGEVPCRGLWLARQICGPIEIDTSRSGTRVVLRYVLPAHGTQADDV